MGACRDLVLCTRQITLAFGKVKVATQLISIELKLMTAISSFNRSLTVPRMSLSA
jgi:hypothetical protein